MAWNGYSEKGQGSEERGPGTFTFAPPATPQAQGSNAVMAKAGYQAAQSVGGVTTYQTAGDKTAAALFGFAETMLKPVLEEVATKKFLEGATRAASGEALTEIVNTQPWYSKIFGPSSAVEGARQYSLDAQAAKFDAAVQKAMPTLRSTSPDELPGIIQKMGKEFETGDPTTDTQLGLRLMKVLPNLIQSHTREFYKAQQEQAYRQRFEAAQANATSLQIVSQDAMASDDDKQLRQATFLQGLVRTRDADPKSHEQFIATTLGSLAESGQFHALSVALNNGALGEMSPENRLRVEKQVGTLKRQAARGASENYVDQLWDIKERVNAGSMTPEEVIAEYKALNDNYTKLSGNDAPMIPRTEALAGARSAQAVLARLDNEHSKAIAEAHGAADKESAILTAISQSTTGRVLTAGRVNGDKVTQAEVFDAFKKKFDAVGPRTGMSPAEVTSAIDAQVTMLARDAEGGTAVDYIKQDINSAFAVMGDDVDDNYLLTHNRFKALEAKGSLGQAAIALYFTDKQATQMRAFDRALGGRDPAKFGEYAIEMSRRVVTDPGYTFTTKEQPLVKEFIDSKVRKNSALKFGVPELSQSSKQVVTNLMASSYGTLKSMNPGTAGMEEAYLRAQAAGLEAHGAYAWVSDPGRPRLKELITPKGGDLTDEDVAYAINSVVGQRIRAITDKTPEDVLVTRTADRAGNPQFLVYTKLDGVLQAPTTFSGDDLKLSLQQRVDKVSEATTRKATDAQRAQAAIATDPTLNRVFSPKLQPFAKGGFVKLQE